MKTLHPISALGLNVAIRKAAVGADEVIYAAHQTTMEKEESGGGDSSQPARSQHCSHFNQVPRGQSPSGGHSRQDLVRGPRPEEKLCGDPSTPARRLRVTPVKTAPVCAMCHSGFILTAI